MYLASLCNRASSFPFTETDSIRDAFVHVRMRLIDLFILTAQLPYDVVINDKIKKKKSEKNCCHGNIVRRRSISRKVLFMLSLPLYRCIYKKYVAFNLK